jgi:hypothetical protein
MVQCDKHVAPFNVKDIIKFVNTVMRDGGAVLLFVLYPQRDSWINVFTGT